MGGRHSWTLPFFLLLLLAPVSLAYVPGPLDWPLDPSLELVPTDEPEYFHLGDDELPALLASGEAPVHTLTVTQDSSKFNDPDTYKSIQEAVNAVPPSSDGSMDRWIIKIEDGVYHGQVEIEKQNLITFLGNPENPRAVQLVGNHKASDVDKEGRVYGTYRSPSLIIRGDDFTAIGVQFVNISPRPAQGTAGGQAVAVRATGDRLQFYNCIFTSFQDTLYAHKGRQFYKNCLIEGTVDFIFGYGQAIFEDCELHARANPYSFTAQKRNLTTDANGFVFLRASLTCEPSLPGRGQAFLGRAWGAAARVYFIDSNMTDVVYPPGWSDMGFPSHQATSSFAEFDNYGPGSDLSQRVSWEKKLTPQDVALYRDPARPFINGASWITIPDDLAPTPEPLLSCPGTETGIAPGPTPGEPEFGPGADAPIPPSFDSVEQLLSDLDAAADYAVFIYLFKNTSLDLFFSTLSEPLTFFPPTDAAFNQLPNATTAVLLGNPNLLKQVLLYHVVQGFYSDAVLRSFQNQVLDSLAGFGIPVTNTAGGILIGQDYEAEVTRHDVFLDPVAGLSAQGINRVLLAPFAIYFVPPSVQSPAPSQPQLPTSPTPAAGRQLSERMMLASDATHNGTRSVLLLLWSMAALFAASVVW